MKFRVMPERIRYDTSWFHPTGGGRGGGLSGLPGPPHTVPADGSPGTPPQGTYCTRGSGPTGGVSPGK